MKEFGDSPSNDSKKERNSPSKYKSSFKLFAKNCWPKVMISRDDAICKKTTDNYMDNSNYSFLEEHVSKLHTKEKKVDYEVEHLCCNKIDANLEEEQRGCLISSSSEIQINSIACGAEGKSEDSFKYIDESIKDHSFIFPPEENEDPEASIRERPIFVDLTTDDKNTSGQRVSKGSCDKKATGTNEKETEKKKTTTNVALEHRIMIADSSSKISCNGTGSIATALRDRGPCLIPVQPNRSLPIRPVPSVPTRSYRKDCATLLTSPKSSNLNMDEFAKSLHTLSSEDVYSGKDINPIKIASKDSMTMADCSVPQVSNVGTETRKRDSGDTAKKKDDPVKEHRKKKRSQTAECSQIKEEGVEYTTRKYLRNLCEPNPSQSIQNLHGEKSSIVVSAHKEENSNKVVPPLKLKKIVRTESEGYSSSQTVSGAERESKYRIITNTDQILSSASSSNWSDVLCEKDTSPAALNTDSYKLKYRRNRLKQKLRELRRKALDLAKQMANDSNSQQSTRLRQVMNRYEKQIENLAKLHSKLSAALPASKEVIDVNDDSTDPLDNACPFAHLKETSVGSVINDNSPRSSPEPPKLSPRSPINYDNVLQEEGPDSPPILPRVCLTISSNQESTDEELQATKKKVWPVDEKSLKAVHPANSSDSDTILSCAEKDIRITPVEEENNVILGLDDSVAYVDNGSLHHSDLISSYPEKNGVIQTDSEMNKSLKGFPQCCLVMEESEKIKYPTFPDSGPIRNSISNGVRTPMAAQEDQMFELLPDKEVNSSTDRVLHSSSYEAVRENVSLSKVNETSPNVQKVTSSTGQSTQLHTMGTMLNQEKPKLQQNYKEEEPSRDSAQRNTDSQSLTEQFPTLGNWLARMSKKQVSKSNSKIQTGGSVPVASAENNIHMKVPGLEIPKPANSHTTNEGVNAASPCSTNKWQYHHHQQQRQQLLQHVASSVTLSQPIATIPPLRPGMCPPMPMSQFYPNNYAIDPYNSSALAYHPTICPYGTYPYHNRIHSSSLPGYHLPMHDNLRAVHHAEKRFPAMQDPMARYPPPSAGTFQHRSNLEFDLRGHSGNNHVATATCLSSLFLPPPTLSPSHQSLPRPPLLPYPTNSQFSRSRMIPDVVAAAAAAAVVAAASFRQRDTLTYNRTNADGLSTAGVANVLDAEPAHVPGPHKSVIAHPDASNHVAQDGNFNEEANVNTKYEQMQNFVLDHLALVKTADNLSHTNTSIDNDNPIPVPPIVSATPYRMSFIQSHAQTPKNITGNETRNCQTPHLGKMNRSPDSLHNFACSNCGIIGPKFKCLGCEMAFYCGERCQEKHWYVHVQKCPKKMPKLKKVA